MYPHVFNMFPETSKEGVGGGGGGGTTERFSKHIVVRTCRGRELYFQTSGVWDRKDFG